MPSDPESPTPQPRKGFSLGRVVILLLYAFFIVRAIVKIINGDVAGQAELAAIIAVTLFLVLPIVALARLLSRSRIGRFFRADSRTSRIFDTKRLVIELRHEPNAFLLGPILIILLYLLIFVIGGIVALVHWVTP
jgi:hypothetical protein